MLVESKKVKKRQNSSKKVRKSRYAINAKGYLPTVLEKGNRVQVPKIIKWQFKPEPNQVLRVGFSVPDKFIG